MSWCAYRNALGVPREGVHRPRMVGDIARNDVLLTVVAALLISLLFFNPSRHPGNYVRIFGVTLVTLLGLGILLHRLFCVRTTVDQWLFPE